MKTEFPEPEFSAATILTSSLTSSVVLLALQLAWGHLIRNREFWFRKPLFQDASSSAKSAHDYLSGGSNH